MDNVKIIRLATGEDIIGFYEEDESSILIGSPMSVMVKRMSSGKSFMMMVPWIPNELVEDDIVNIPNSQIITIMNPKKSIYDYYVNSVIEMEKELDEMDDDLFGELSLRDASQSDSGDIENDVLDMFEGITSNTSSKKTIH